MNVLTVANVRKKFGQVVALDGATFELRQGELLALLGPNGAGKTTLIRAVAGRVRLDGGEIRVFDRVLDGRRTPPELGIVPQEVAIYPLLTARENLEVFGRLHGLAGDALAKQVDWALERTGLADRARESVKHFSGGMRRRLNIACGVLHRPRVVLLDEPTVGVDPQSRDRIYDMLAELAQSGVSLLLTTHHLEEAEARCSRTVIIDHGNVIAAGTLPELVDQTVGRYRLVTLRLDAPLSAAGTAGLAAGTSTRASDLSADADDGRVIKARMRDVALELPPLLERIRQAGRSVDDVEVRGPSLQAVFIHLTGRELRE
jgi:ABC-2 type transport system ATP-binding protein